MIDAIGEWLFNGKGLLLVGLTFIITGGIISFIGYLFLKHLMDLEL